MIRRFHFERLEDLSGVSGTGVVAEGVLFSDGWVAIHWLSMHRCVTIYQSFAEMKEVHGHNGKTVIVWDDERSDEISNTKQTSSSTDNGRQEGDEKTENEKEEA